MEEIIVYLISCKSIGYGTYVDLYFDFRTSRDVSRFQARANMALEAATILHIKSYTTTKRLRSGSYYAFNVNYFRKALIERERQDSFLVAYDVTLNEGLDDQDEELFMSHEPLDTEDLRIKGGAPIEILPEIYETGNTKVIVYDVEQANYNEVLNNDNVTIVYDAGAPLSWKKTEVQRFFSKRKEQYEKQDGANKPLLVISHWDYDHIHCLKGLSVNDMKNLFCGVVFPDRYKSHTLEIIIEKMKVAFPNNYWNVKIRTLRGIKQYDVECLAKRNLYSLYIGRSNSRNINLNGLIMPVYGGSTQTVLTGDCCITQLYKTINNEVSLNNRNVTRNNIVVPHHGGASLNEKGIFIPQNSINYFIAAYSYGYNNAYGHPSISIRRLTYGIYRHTIDTVQYGNISI